MAFTLPSTEGTNAALHSGPPSSRQLTGENDSPGFGRTQQNDFDAIVLRSVIG
jgi:hypothetical protein